MTESNKKKQSKTKTKQNKTKQNKTKQNKQTNKQTNKTKQTKNNNKKQEKFRWPEHFKSLNKKNCKICIVKQRKPLTEQNNY